MRQLVSIRLLLASCIACVAMSVVNTQASTSVQTLGPSWTGMDGLLDSVDNHWSTQRYRSRIVSVNPFLIPLGAMKKRDGVWRPEAFWPVSGDIERVTWSVTGESVVTLFETFRSSLLAAHALRWECQGRSCGNAAEWASRVFEERLLYGRDEHMRYAAFESDNGSWIILYSAARTADRQYLHIDIVR